MATKGRDFKVSFLTDLDQFNADAGADQLDNLADAATKAGRTVKTLDDAGDAAGKSLRTLDDDTAKASRGLKDFEGDARSTAKKVDDSFDKIKASSRATMKSVDHDAREGGAGLDEFKDEANSTTKEVAASFGSVEDALSGVQEIAANALGGFGPAGAAAGAAAAVGIGFLSSALQKTADEANATKDRVIGLARAIQEAGGNLDDVDVVSLMREWNDEIADNKSWWEVWQESNVTNLEKFSAQAKASGLDLKDFVRGVSGVDAMAAKRSLDEINAKMAEHAQESRTATEASSLFTDQQSVFKTETDDVRIGIDAQTRSLKEAKDALLAKAGVDEAAIARAALEQEALGRVAIAQEDLKQALADHAAAYESFTNPAGVYTDLLATMTAAEQEKAQKTADSTEDEKDTWQDYVNSVDVSVDQYLDALERQVVAQEQWAGNLQRLAKRGVDEGVLAELERMGPEGAPLVAKLTKSSDAELARMVTLFGRKGEAAGAAVASNLANKSGAVSRSAQELHTAAAVQLARQITVPVKLADVSRAAQEAWLDADRYFRNHPVEIRTRRGARPIRDVP